MVARRISLAAGIAGIVAALAVIAGVPAHRDAAAAVPPMNAWHVHLLKSEPANNDTLHAAPTAVKLWFSEDVELAITSVKLGMSMGGSTTPVALSAVQRDAAPKSPVVANITGKVTPGTYTIAWKTAATDGHPASGLITFVLAGGR